MVNKFANVYTFRNRKTGDSFIARWDVSDGGQTNYTGPSPDYDFVSLEVNAPDGQRTEAEAFQIGLGVAQLPSFVTGQHTLITPVK